MLQGRDIEPHGLAVHLALQLSTSTGFDVLLVVDAPVDALVSDHRSICYSLVWLEVVGTPGDPFASLDLATLGVAHVVSGLSC